MQRLLVVLLSLSIALTSANQASSNANLDKRAPRWKGQNLGGGSHADTEDRGGGKAKARRWTGAAQDEALPGDSHIKGGSIISGKRSPITIPLVRRASPHHRPIRGGLLSSTELKKITAVTDVDWLQASRDALIDKYADGESAKRSLRERRKKRDAQDAVEEEMKKRSEKEKRVVKDIAITNHNFDTVYSANLLLGTPAKAFSVLLDTGSSDTWITASNCTCTSTNCDSCVSGNSWDPSSSSTYARRGKVLQISYGSGVVSGWTANDVASLGGFSISDQIFGVVDSAASVLPGDVEGLMGLAFGYIARAGGTPWWLRVVNGETGAGVDGGVMSFWLSRYIGASDTSQNDHPGGQFILGGTNSSLYTGDISYTPVIQPAKWWLIPLSAVGIQGGQNVDVGVNASYSIVDTGTTLIGGQDIVVDAVLSTINGAAKGETIATKLRGFYALPCDVNTTVTFTFSGIAYPMSARDLLYMRIDDLRPNYCLASLFVYSSMDPHSFNFREPNTPYWLIGDSFLKNVYSVFDLGSSWTSGGNTDGSSSGQMGMGNTGTTAQVGFAALSGVDGEVGMAAQGDTGDTGGSSSTTATIAGSTVPANAQTGLPLGVIPDVLTTVVVVTATQTPTATPSTSGAGRVLVSGGAFAALVGGLVYVVAALL